MRSIAFSILVLAGVMSLVVALNYTEQRQLPAAGACCGLPLIVLGLALLGIELFTSRFFHEAAARLKQPASSGDAASGPPEKSPHPGDGGPMFPIVEEGTPPQPPLRRDAGRPPQDDDFPDDDVTIPEDTIR